LLGRGGNANSASRTNSFIKKAKRALSIDEETIGERLGRYLRKEPIPKKSS